MIPTLSRTEENFGFCNGDLEIKLEYDCAQANHTPLTNNIKDWKKKIM